MGIINEKKKTSVNFGNKENLPTNRQQIDSSTTIESDGKEIDTDKTQKEETTTEADFIRWIEKDGKFVLTGSSFDAETLRDSALKLASKLEGGDKHNFLTTCCRAFGWDLSQLNNDLKANLIRQDEADEQMTNMIDKSVEVSNSIRSFSDEPPKVTSIDLNDKKLKESAEDEEKPDDSFEEDEEF